MSPNPFTPTFGKVPPHLAGREDIVSEIAQAFDNGPGDPNLSTILVGARGTGKTALLTCLADEAALHGWVTASVSATPGMLDDILQRAGEAAAKFIEEPNKIAIKEIGIPQVFSLKLDRPLGETPNWRSKMNRLFQELEPLDIGLLITVDEVSVDLDEMVQLASVYQHFVRENRKVALVMAGLPYQVSELVGDKRISFLRRARRRVLGRVSDADVENALLATVEDAGKQLEASAVEAALAAIEGFPYMMQLVGYRSWAASKGPMITSADVERGARQALDEFRTGIIETTYSELSPTDVRFCQAMTEDSRGSRLADIANRMGVKSNYASQYKKRLLLAGVIDDPSGLLRFAIPGFGEFLKQA